jgi:hypothetical protein
MTQIVKAKHESIELSSNDSTRDFRCALAEHLHIVEQSHESKIHVELLVAVKQR